MRVVTAISYIVVLAICNLGIQGDVQVYSSISFNVTDVVNLYVVDFSGANNKSYFFNDVTTLQYDNLFVGTQKTNLTFSGNYINLEKQIGVRERDQLPLRPTPLAEAITRLWYGGSVAEPLLVVIQMVSEAARFKYIEEQVRKSITDGNTFTPKGLIVSMENK
ncbi:hypothetical protein ACSBR2_017539 [Camellia fascicularis]